MFVARIRVATAAVDQPECVLDKLGDGVVGYGISMRMAEEILVRSGLADLGLLSLALL